MSQIKQVLLGGYGGQGIVLAGTLLGQAAFMDGKWVSGTNSYGAAARGGSCRAEVVISDQSVIFPYVMEADILIALCQTAYSKYVGEMKRGTGTVIFDSGLVTPKEVGGLQYCGIPATKTALEELGREIVANVVMLGATAEITGMVTKEALISAIKQIVPEKLRELDLKAAEIGFALAKNAGAHVKG
jgi:2-oxoglutarate ferredoxin oxidoreductase subunit gamma